MKPAAKESPLPVVFHHRHLKCRTMQQITLFGKRTTAISTKSDDWNGLQKPAMPA
jgi:hypothetical protein